MGMKDKTEIKISQLRAALETLNGEVGAMELPFPVALAIREASDQIVQKMNYAEAERKKIWAKYEDETGKIPAQLEADHQAEFERLTETPVEISLSLRPGDLWDEKKLKEGKQKVRPRILIGLGPLLRVEPDGTGGEEEAAEEGDE